jgi:hypothetical protein
VESTWYLSLRSVPQPLNGDLRGHLCCGADESLIGALLVPTMGPQALGRMRYNA